MAKKGNMVLCACVLSIGELKDMIEKIESISRETLNGNSATNVFDFGVDIKKQHIFTHLTTKTEVAQYNKRTAKTYLGV